MSKALLMRSLRMPIDDIEKIEDDRDEGERTVDEGFKEELKYLQTVEKQKDSAHIARLGLVLTKPFRLWFYREVNENDIPAGGLAMAVGISFGNLLASVANQSSDPGSFTKIAMDTMMRVFGQRLKKSRILKPSNNNMPSRIIRP